MTRGNKPLNERVASAGNDTFTNNDGAPSGADGGVMMFSDNSSMKAIAVVREQIEASAGAPDPYYRLGLILRQQRRSEEARATFQKVSRVAARKSDGDQSVV